MYNVCQKESVTRVELMKHVSRYHEKREKNNIAVNKFRKDKSVKDLGKMKQLELVRMMMIRMVFFASKFRLN